MDSTVNHIITLLALYFAAVILAVQYVSDRYSFALSTPMLRRYDSVPLVVLVVLAMLGVLLPARSRAVGAIMAMPAILTSLYGSYYLWSKLGNSERIAELLHMVPTRRRKSAMRETLWNALSAVSANDANGYFEHSGYKTLQDHSL
jgi:hypothetical protein